MRVALAFASLLLAAPLAAQTDAESQSPAHTNDPATDPACANVRVAFPPELAGWSQQTPVSAGVKPGEGATIAVGQGALVSLHPGRHLALSPAPKNPAGAGGTLAFEVATPGTYRIALSGKAWIDVLHAGKSLASVAHAHGPKCTGVRKMVDFKLAPGNYTLQLSGADADSITLLVARLA